MRFGIRRPSRLSEGLLTSCLIAVLAPPPAPARVDHTKLEPRVVGKLPPRLDIALRAAFVIALERLRANPRCRAPFSELGANGQEVLAATVYYAASKGLDDRVCRRRSAAAFTVVGSPTTGLCARNFIQLSRFQAALYLIHEALHHAGLPEWPPHPGAPTSNEIQRLVQRSCGARAYDESLRNGAP